MILAQKKNIQNIFFLTFILLSTLMPRLGAIDNNAIRWFTVSIFSLAYLFNLIRLGRFKLLVLKDHIIFTGLLFIYLLLSVFISKNNIEGFVTLYKIVTLIVVYFISYDILKKGNSFITLCVIFSISVLIESFVILIQFFSSYEWIVGVASNPNISSSSLIFKLPFVIFLNQNEKNKSYKFLLKIIEVVSIIGIIILGSRLGFISLFIIYFLYFLWYKKNRLAQVFSIIIIIAVSFFINNIKSTNDEILSFPITETLATDESLNQRLNFYKKALNLSFKKPLFGYGLGSWKYESLPYEEGKNEDLLVPYYTHNDFLQTFFELGLLGLFAYLVILMTLIKKIIRTDAQFKGVLIITFIIFLLNSLLNFPLHRSQEIIPFIIVVSFIFCSNNKGNEKRRKLSSLIIISAIIPVLVLSFLEHSSLKVQGKLFSDYNLNTYSFNKNEIDNINYFIPNLSANGVPISTYVSRYYFENKDYNRSLSLLKSSSKANYKDLMTQELLLKNYIFLGKNNLAVELSKNLMLTYPDNSLYSEIYFSLIAEQKLKD